MSVGLTRYGRRELITYTAMAAAACALLVMLAMSVNWMFALLCVLPAVFWLWVLWFFRDPDRPTPQDDGLVISPADGNVADITPVGADSVLGCEGVKIGIFMNVFSVHVNRSPVAARVDRTVHQDGVFLDARDPHASERNESATIYLTHSRQGQDYPVVVRQIAGLIARRIITDVDSGRELAVGERFGMIKFGSRVEVFLPRALAGRICVEPGRKVRAGLTVLASVHPETADGQ